MARVLVVGNVEKDLSPIVASVAGLNHFVSMAWDERSLTDALAKGSPEAVIIDVRPGESCIASIKALVTYYDHVAESPRIAVASDASLEFLLTKFIDDFIIYPFNQQELSARLTRMLTRSQKLKSGNLIIARGLVIDTESFEVTVDGRQLNLTYKEFELLRYIASRPGRVFTREALLNQVWGFEYFGGLRTVDVHIRRLRAKLGPKHEDLIQTTHGVGYKFVP